ncbi:NACHT domain-containing protein [Thermomonospora curvata]|uniref:Putative signal transduction protein with Nacht domain n=1 Tax=Thermomonospora curvata (strain ATCC 19995 / DSM 43183 / JCM 3096 / KCTC 9072 / NBRC 15933 / NCIMB 10081 / Henssen B9) TaxID=471852 RepID=D1A5C2_THECD|nr:putative signal transduction protein with Nacht domain [Thermomonospora curvata DSM 43183]
MSVEGAALRVGGAVAQLVAGRWLASRTARAAASKDLVELIKTGIPDEIKRRKTQRQFEAVADAVTERLLTFARQEFGGLDDADRQAVLHQVVLTLERADLSDEALLADDMDPVKLARRLRRTLPAREAEFQLGEAGARLYEVVLEECCECLARILIHLPQFEPRALAETLSRLSRMTEQVEAALARLPVRSLTAPEGEENDEEFTRRYLAFISESLDRLELFGVRFERFTRPQTTLSVAYISLNASPEDRPRTRRAEAVPISDWRSDERDGRSVRVEQALGAHRRVLIRGEAGGGKSTLLRWLAITAARGGFTGELSELNGHVPFLIKLRSHAGQALPRPEEYLDDVAGNLSGLMPRGWVHRRLLSGRALLLVDGVDEVTDSQRPAVRQWLQQIVAQFPSIRIVVTSRPAAAAAGWLRAEGFGTVFLEPLGPADLRALVRHWHEAVRDCADLPCPPERLPAHEARLLARLESAPHLRTLAATPLLAAMLCALNLDRQALPRDRMGLYAAALDMLLETRDAQRNVPSARAVPLERDQKIRILQDLAWHLSTSNRVELPKPMVQRLIADRLATMPQVRAGAEAVLEALLERSGVLREPVPGRIDFVHRTVQEYLAAKQAADLGDMDLLIRNAHRDQWRETVVMAAGHANEPLRRELITGILDRARTEPRQARRLKLLAVACLETLPAVPDDLRAALDQCLDELVPPRTSAMARSLATAGEPVLARLPKTLEGLSESAAIATVRTAWLINGPQALDVLARYATDQRFEVQEELSIAWQYFDPDEYAERVLANRSPGGYLSLCSSAQLAALSKAPSPATLALLLDGPTDLSPLTGCADSIHRIVIYSPKSHMGKVRLPELPKADQLFLNTLGFTDLKFLDKLPSLERIWLGTCKDVTDYSPLLQFTELRTLSMYGCRALRSLRQLPPLDTVTSLGLSSSHLQEGLGSLIAAAPNVNELILTECDWLHDLGPLAEIEIRDLRIAGSSVSDLRPLSGQTRLWHLNLSKNPITDLTPLQDLPALEELLLTDCAGVTDLRPLASLPRLKKLCIEGIAPGTDLSPLAQNQRVNVYIYAGQDVRGGEALGRRLKIR